MGADVGTEVENANVGDVVVSVRVGADVSSGGKVLPSIALGAGPSIEKTESGSCLAKTRGTSAKRSGDKRFHEATSSPNTCTKNT